MEIPRQNKEQSDVSNIKLPQLATERDKYRFINGRKISVEELDCEKEVGPWYEQYARGVRHE